MASAAAGWLVIHDQPVPVSHAGAPTANAQPSPVADHEQVLVDGTVSIPVRSELARQGADVSLTSSAPPVATNSAPMAAGAPSAEVNSDSDDDAPDTVEALRALGGSDESTRLAALQQVSSGEAVVPAELLQQMVDSDPSEAIREEAFRALVELRSHDPDALHQLLEAGLTSTSATVVAESKARLGMDDERAQVANARP